MRSSATSPLLRPSLLQLSTAARLVLAAVPVLLLWVAVLLTIG